MQSWATNAARSVSLALGLGLATTAFATPPRIVNVEDRLFARNDGTLFILREVTDNLGFHQVTQTDTLLIFRDLQDGTDTGFAVVERMRDNGADSGPERAIYETPETAQNPYAIRAEHGAWPLGPALRSPSDIWLDTDGIRLADEWSDTTYALSLTELQARLTATLLSVRHMAPAFETSTNVDSFDPHAFDILAECSVDGRRTLNHTKDDPALVSFSCNDHETGQFARLLILVPQV